MTENNIYSVLRAYFQYQYDIGIDEIVFDHGTDIKNILTGGASTQSARASLPSSTVKSGYGSGYQSTSSAQMSRPIADGHRYDDRRQSGIGEPSPLSRLAGIKTVDALDVKRAIPVVNSAKREKLAGLYREVMACDKCRLSQSRAKVVFGAGSADGRLLVIGDCPQPQDEAAGLPFQGERGDLFSKIADKMGLDRKRDIFAAYLQKCTGGEGFDKGCANICKSIIDRQIDIIDPKAILIFGQQAANVILENGDDIERLRSANHTYRNRPLVVTYCLSLMLKEMRYRHGAWDDMQKILKVT